MSIPNDPPLFQGLKVIDCASWIAAPSAATILGDMGAEVIKVEPTGWGDAYRIFPRLVNSPKGDSNYSWQLTNHSKKSLSLNLKSEAGRMVLHQLIDGADIFITNLPVRNRQALSLSYEQVHQTNQQIIYASLTAMGESGPKRHDDGFDQVSYWAHTGLLGLMGRPGQPPSRALAGSGDHPSAVALFAAIACALYKKERTGQGSLVHTSLLANGYWAGAIFATAALAGADFQHFEQNTAWLMEPYRTQDDRWLAINMMRFEEQQQLFLRLIGLEHLLKQEIFADLVARNKAGSQMHNLVQEQLAQRALDEWLQLFEPHQFPLTVLGRSDQLCTDEQAQAVGVVQQPPEGSDLPHAYVAHPIGMQGQQPVPPSAAPKVGQHTDQVLAELGYSPEQITQMREDKVVQ